MLRALVFNDTAVQRHYGCNAVMETLTRGLDDVGVETAWLWPVSMNWQRREGRLLKMPADVIVVNGEGTIHHSAERKRARHLLELAPFARRKGVPIVLVNSTVEALAADDVEHLRGFDAVFVRESRSHAYLNSVGIASTIAPDLSLGIAPGQAVPRSGLLVTDSVSRPIAERLRTFAEANGGRFEAMQSRPGFLERMGVRVMRGIPGHLMGRRHFERSVDVEPFVARLRAADTVVTGRFHTVLLCLLTDTPVLAVGSNTSKIEATLTDALGDASRMMKVEHLISDAAMERLATAAYDEAELRALAAYRERACEGRELTFSKIADLAAQSRAAT